VALLLEHDGRARATIGACGPAPVGLATADDALSRNDPAAAGALLAEALDPVDDSRASGAYRRRVAPRLLARSFADAKAELAGASL
jgi:CO/xanthine dehydrogenase FAD-binding subunit